MSVGEILERDEDRPAYVRFERRAVKDNEATLKEGHYVSRDEDYALITPPYSKDVIEKKVESWFEQVKVNVTGGRIPEKHFDLWKESYRRWQDGQEMPVDGTSVKDWNVLSPAQCQNLINAGCRTIEDLAQANDEAMRRLGMGGIDLRNKARAWLQAGKDHGPLIEEIAQLKNQNAQLQGTIDSLQDQIKRFEIRIDAQDGEYKPMEHSAQAISPVMASPESSYEGYETLNITPADVVKPTLSPQEQHTKNLKDAYKAKFGKFPAGRMKDETILKKLQE